MDRKVLLWTSVNDNFTFEHLQWFHNQLKSSRYIANVSFFLSGGLGCILGHGGDRQPPGSHQGNTPGGGGPPGGNPPNWPKNMGGDDPPPNPPPYGGPPTQSPPPNEGEPHAQNLLVSMMIPQHHLILILGRGGSW